MSSSIIGTSIYSSNVHADCSGGKPAKNPKKQTKFPPDWIHQVNTSEKVPAWVQQSAIGTTHIK